MAPPALLVLERNGEVFQIPRGEIDDYHRAENEMSLVQGFRLLSAYTLADGTRIWVITEVDRSSTCILLPEEY